MRRDIAAQKFLASRPEAQALYAKTVGEQRLDVRAAADGKPAEILLYDEIGFWGTTASDFVKALASAGEGPITLRISSPGGDVFDGIAIANAIKARGGVTAVVDGLAASAASFIMIAADAVQIHESAMVMVHKAWGFTVGNEDDHLEQAITLGKIDGVMAGMYAGKTGKTTEEMSAVMAAETWFTAAEAMEAGLVDEVIKAAEKPAPRVAAESGVVVAVVVDQPPPAPQEPARSTVSAHEIEIRKRRLALADAA